MKLTIALILALSTVLFAARRSGTQTQTSTQQPCTIVTPPSATSVAAQIANDMIGNHEGHPHGVPSYWDSYNGPIISQGNNAGSNRALVMWGVITVDAGGSPATNTRVNVRNVQAWWLRKSTNTWVLGAETSTPEVGWYAEDYSRDYGLADVRNEPDGSISTIAYAGKLAHYYAPYPRIPIDPTDLAGVVVVAEMRLILANPNGPDDRASSRFLGQSGADYYPAPTGPGISNNPGVGGGKFKYVIGSWRSFAMTTLSLAQLESNPPPINLDGVLP